MWIQTQRNDHIFKKLSEGWRAWRYTIHYMKVLGGFYFTTLYQL